MSLLMAVARLSGQSKRHRPLAHWRRSFDLPMRNDFFTLGPSLAVALPRADWLGLTKGHKSRAKNNNNDKKKQQKEQTGFLGSWRLHFVRLFLHKSGTNGLTAALVHTSSTGLSEAAAGKTTGPRLKKLAQVPDSSQFVSRVFEL